MDPVTDQLVMRTVVEGEQFAQATVIIIAHRLATVMNTDTYVRSRDPICLLLLP